MSQIAISVAAEEDLAEILALQKAAFQSEAEHYGPDIQPMRQTLEELRAEAREWTILKLAEGGRIAGSVRGRMDVEGTVRVGKLIVHPDFRRRGFGLALLAAIEAAFPGRRRMELFTNAASHWNVRLYERAGYKTFKEQPFDKGMMFVFMEKIVHLRGQ